VTRSVAIIGGGQVAAVAARTLRRRGFDGAITLIGDEPHLPYQRPPLSKGFLQGREQADDLVLINEQWCADNAVDLRIGVPVTGIDPFSRRLGLADGSSVRADSVLFATGGRPRVLPGITSERVVYLRTIDHAIRVRASLQPGSRLITVGGGFIGAEIAASARTAGADVTMIEMLDVPLKRALGHELGEVCAQIHRDHGVTVLTNEFVESVRDITDGVVVRTAGGREIEGDLVVVGVGIEPNAELAKATGIAVDNGILVDEFCRTSVDGIYAAGDVANHQHPVFEERVRVEHFDNANRQAAAAAMSIMGRRAAYDNVHWFWSDQYEFNLQYAGHAPVWTQAVVRGSVEAQSFTVFYLHDGVVKGAFAIDRGEEIVWAKELIAAQATPDPAMLADEDLDLEGLVGANVTQA
jgi:3-phenylpropionate/trans-cinnamate dioxygenase ferredoxin reductase subunit